MSKLDDSATEIWSNEREATKGSPLTFWDLTTFGIDLWYNGPEAMTWSGEIVFHCLFEMVFASIPRLFQHPEEQTKDMSEEPSL